jgi:hypothetical protein
MILNTLIIGGILWPARAVDTIFPSPFTSLLGSMLYRDRGRFVSVVHRRFEIFDLTYSQHLQTIYTSLFA